MRPFNSDAMAHDQDRARSYSKLFASRGCKILVNDLSKENADKVVKEIESAGGELVRSSTEGLAYALRQAKRSPITTRSSTATSSSSKQSTNGARWTSSSTCDDSSSRCC